MKNQRSEKLFKKSLEYFPGGVNSPVRAFRSVKGTPRFMAKGKGCRTWDADGNEYIDFCGSWGPLISGHAHPEIINAIKKAVDNGTTFGAPTEAENELAELILSNNRFIEKLRFVSSGTEAVMSAIRLARGFTKKNKVIKFEGCYHGHADSMLVKAGSGLVTFGSSSSEGIPVSFVNETLVVQLNNEEAVSQAFKEFGHDIAAVIIEPVPANNGLLIQRPEFLKFLREITRKNNSLLIFDEVITGFRIGFEGAAGYYNIHPDIITYGKIIGGGLPVGAYGSSHVIMNCVSPDGPVYQAGTLSGNPVAMAAGIAQIKQCLKHGFYESLSEKAEYFTTTITEHASIRGYKFNIHSMGSIFWFAFSDKKDFRSADEIDPNTINLFNRFYHYLLENGIYLGPSGYEVGFISEVHEQSDLDEAIKIINKGLDFTFNTN